MKNLLLSLMFLFPASGAMAQDKPAPEETPEKTQSVEERIRQLIEELGADAYQVREKAQIALEKIGKPALEALKKALKGADLEVSSRAQELIEKITGRNIPEAEPEKEFPASPGESPFNPDDMKGMLDKLKEFEGLSPNLKKTIDSFRKILEGKNGAPDLGVIGKLFEDFFNQKLPGLPGPDQNSQEDSLVLTDPQLKTAIEIRLGLEVEPIDDVLRAHLNVSPFEAIEDGLIIKHINHNGHAFKQGLRQYDILVFISTEPAPKTPLPGPQGAWNAWRNKALKPGRAAQLGHLKGKSFVEVIRKGKSCQIIEMAPLSTKKKDGRGF